MTSSAHSTNPQPASPLARRLDAVVDAALNEERIVGLELLVAMAGATVYHRAAGLADREARRPVHPDTIFRLASFTKPMGR
jgi:CubicO group peptidase (beta-lactamase class C family)